jgi:hypothetical protein
MLDRENALYYCQEANRLHNSSKFHVSRALRRFLSEVVTNAGYVFQSFSFDEGFSATQLAALQAHAKQVDDEYQEFIAPLGFTRLDTQFDEEFGSISNGYRLPFLLVNATLKELQATLKVVAILAEGLVPLRNDPGEVAGFDDYRYRGLPCSIADDDQLWLVGGHDKRGGSGVLEWCYDEDDAREVLASMQRFPDRFVGLRAEPHTRGAGMHWAVAEVLETPPQHAN